LMSHGDDAGQPSWMEWERSHENFSLRRAIPLLSWARSLPVHTLGPCCRGSVASRDFFSVGVVQCARLPSRHHGWSSRIPPFIRASPDAHHPAVPCAGLPRTRAAAGCSRACTHPAPAPPAETPPALAVFALSQTKHIQKDNKARTERQVS